MADILTRYPMALGNLGDCEEICETPGRPPPINLFNEAIESAKTNYDNYHVYPYTYLGGHYYRKGEYKEAIQAWADASSVIKKLVSPVTCMFFMFYVVCTFRGPHGRLANIRY